MMFCIALIGATSIPLLLRDLLIRRAQSLRKFRSIFTRIVRSGISAVQEWRTAKVPDVLALSVEISLINACEWNP